MDNTSDVLQLPAGIMEIGDNQELNTAMIQQLDTAATHLLLDSILKIALNAPATVKLKSDETRDSCSHTSRRKGQHCHISRRTFVCRGIICDD